MTEQTPPEIQAALEKFERLAEVYPVDYVPEMRRLLDETMVRFSPERAQFFGPNLPLAWSLEEKCRLLFSKYPSLSTSDRALAVGAIRYFIVGMDAHSDQEPLHGLDDDLFIMNMVLEKLSLPTLT